MKNLIILTFLLFFGKLLFAQTVILSNQMEIEKTVKNELVLLVNSKSFKQQITKKFAYTRGYALIDLSINHKGKAISMFTNETDITNIDFLEYLTDQILKHNFNFRLERNQIIKIRQRLTF